MVFGLSYVEKSFYCVERLWVKTFYLFLCSALECEIYIAVIELNQLAPVS